MTMAFTTFLRGLLGSAKPLTLEEAARTMSEAEAQRTVAPLDQEQERLVRSILMDENIPLSSNGHVTVWEYRAAMCLVKLRATELTANFCRDAGVPLNMPTSKTLVEG
jgi:hypothetical protein